MDEVQFQLFADELKKIGDDQLKYIIHRLSVISHALGRDYGGILHLNNRKISHLLALQKIIEESWKVAYREQQAREGKVSYKYK